MGRRQHQLDAMRQRITEAALELHATVGRDAPARNDALTPREVEVLRLIATGKTNRSIAAGGNFCVRR